MKTAALIGIVLIAMTLSGRPSVAWGTTVEMLRRKCAQTGREIVQLTNHPSVNAPLYPTCVTWSSDGRHIFFESTRPHEGAPDGSWQLMQADVESGELTWLTSIDKEDVTPYGDAQIEGLSSCYHSDYAPGTDRLVFYDRTGHHLYGYDRKSSRTIELWHEKEGTIGDPPDYAADGSRVVFYVVYPGPKENRIFTGRTSCIFVLDIDVETGEAIGGPRLITAYPERKGTENSGGPIIIDHCQFNPVNKELIGFAHEYGAGPSDGNPAKERIWVIGADGRGERSLVRRNAEQWPTHEIFGPKGKDVYYADMGGAFRVNIESGKIDTIVPVGDRVNLCHISISPDEKYIVGDSFIEIGKTEDGLSLGGIYRVNVETGESRLLCVEPFNRRHPRHPHPNFSPDGTRVVFATATPDGCCNLAVIDVTE